MKKLAFIFVLFSYAVFADNHTTGVFIRGFSQKISVDYIICEAPYINCTFLQNITIEKNASKKIDAPKDYLVSIEKICDLKNNDCHSWYFNDCSVKARNMWGSSIWFTTIPYWTCNIGQ